MLVLAVLLGAWFGWLAEKASRILADAWKSLTEKHKKIAVGLRVGWWCLSVLLFLGAVFIFAGAHYDSYTSYLTTSRTQALRFITASKQLTALTAFLLGWFCYAFRDWLRTLSQQLSSKSSAATPPNSRHPTGHEGHGRRSGQAWLTGGLVVAILGALITVAILAMEPDALSRLVEVKFGSVEARFAAATEHSVRTSAPFFGGTVTARLVLQRGVQLPEVLEDVFEPVEDRLNGGLNDTERKAVSEQRARVSTFLKAFAVPLAEAVKCHLQEFPVADTEVQHEAVQIANRWRHVTLSAASKEHDPSRDFDELTGKTFALINTIIGKLPPDTIVTRGTRPKYPSEAQSWRPLYMGCDFRTPDLPTDWKENTKQHLAEILSDGVVLTFLANLVAFTENFEVSAEFLDALDRYVDRGRVIGRFYFYDTRSKAKYFAHWYPTEAIRTDITEARSAVEEILRGMPENTVGTGNEWQDKLKFGKQYFEVEKARMVNNRIYFLITEWLEGRRLLPKEVDELQTLSTELDRWIALQPSAPGSRQSSSVGEIGGIAKLIDDRQASAIAAFYDTLATEEIVMAQLEKDKNRCSRILRYLDKAHDSYSELAKKATEAEYRDSFKIVQAHRSMYEGVCTQ